MISPSAAIPLASSAKATPDAMSTPSSEMEAPSVTIVSAADAGYFWGLFLLAASNAKSGMGLPMSLLTKGFSDRQKELLRQFPGSYGE